MTWWCWTHGRTDDVVKSQPWPTRDRLARHLEVHHGMPVAVLAEHTPTEHQAWHEAEHRNLVPGAKDQRHAGHLEHSHPPRK